MWVWADPLGQADTTPVGVVHPTKAYVFETHFYIEVDPSRFWVEIKGKWSADNFGQIKIDGSNLPPGSGGGSVSLPPRDMANNYQQAHPFSIWQAHQYSFSFLHLKIGLHTLQVWVYNEGTPGDDPSINPAGFNLREMQILKHPGRAY